MNDTLSDRIANLGWAVLTCPFEVAIRLPWRWARFLGFVASVCLGWFFIAISIPFGAAALVVAAWEACA